MKVVVAGAGGFIGGHLVRRLVADGHEVRAVDVKPLEAWYQRTSSAEDVVDDLTEPAACRRAVDGAERVFNLAADMGGMGFIESHKADCMLSVLTSTNLIKAARDAGVQRFFFASSACVYGTDKQRDVAGPPLRETDAYPAMPEDGYGWEKLFSERMCRHFTEDFGLETRIARYHNVYGPYGAFDGGREKAPAAICRKVFDAGRSGTGTVEVWGDGRQTRTFMYVDDCIEGTLRIMDADVTEPLNLGSSELVTIDQLVSMVAAVAGLSIRVTHRLDAPVGVRGRSSDNTALRACTGWEPSIGLRAGLESTYQWIAAQRSSA